MDTFAGADGDQEGHAVLEDREEEGDLVSDGCQMRVGWVSDGCRTWCCVLTSAVIRATRLAGRVSWGTFHTR